MTQTKTESSYLSLPLVSLALACFCIGTSEFAITGLLPQVSSDMHTSIPVAGYLVSAYAAGVVIGAPIIALVTTRLNRKRLLLSMMTIFVIGSIICAIAPNYGILMGGRIIASLTQGGFHGAGVVVAASLVPAEKRGWAIAFMFTGFTVSNLVGVPAAAAVGEAWGWRGAFWVIAGLGLASLVILVATVPRNLEGSPGSLADELQVFRRVPVWLGLITTAIGFSGVFATFTYVAPLLTHVSGYGAGAVAWLLAVVGLGLVVGNVVGGRWADRNLWGSVLGTLTALIVASLLMAAAAPHHLLIIGALFLFGFSALSTVTPLQTQILEAAGSAPTLASAANISAFNLGNAVGAWIGGLVILHGFGYRATSVTGAILAAVGLAVALVAAAGARRSVKTA